MKVALVKGKFDGYVHISILKVEEGSWQFVDSQYPNYVEPVYCIDTPGQELATKDVINALITQNLKDNLVKYSEHNKIIVDTINNVPIPWEAMCVDLNHSVELATRYAIDIIKAK